MIDFGIDPESFGPVVLELRHAQIRRKGQWISLLCEHQLCAQTTIDCIELKHYGSVDHWARGELSELPVRLREAVERTTATIVAMFKLSNRVSRVAALNGLAPSDQVRSCAKA